MIVKESVIKPKQILEYCLNNFDDLVCQETWGEVGVFYNPDLKLKKGVYVLTIKEKDGKNDSGSNLDRAGIFRVNIGVRKTTFIKLFGTLPARAAAGELVDMPYDFGSMDTILPHPVYAWMGWISIINPSKHTFEELKVFIQESYDYAKEKYSKRK